MTSLSEIRAGASHVVRQEEGEIAILWRARHIDPAALFAADALISALFEISSSAKPGAPDEDLSEAERLARNAEGSPLERQRAELRAQQEMARSIVREISTDDGASWRPVVWVDSEEEEFDRPDGPIGLHIGWISRQALNALILTAGGRLRETHRSRFRRDRSEE